ncbi:hypothetical protein [Phenylobacterium sp.]|uniref:hypothetical protein n=1 Tax=Phenylobacterium sp. TaxID=1871053 RepID=UPI002C2A73FF|nr:hypothetical protein [Phenylobacterium sp.]HLZ75615.1 hypothetical protein [Phenylobacterium sp.]
MEIHRPKAIHGLRELAKEIAIIVVGVLIALGAEQAVEALHWAHRVADAEDAMRVELRHGERDAYYRLAIRPCAVAQLDGIERALAASRDRGTPVAAIAPYRRPRRPWQSDAWDSARALQITGHMPTARLSAWSQAYFFAEVLHATQPQERAALSEINTLTLNAGRLQPAERDRLYGALVRARELLTDMDLGGWLLIQRGKALGLQLSSAEKAAELASARDGFGACAAAPDMGQAPH